jgi:hypothetical protein
VTPMLVEIPTSGAVRERLAQVEAAVRAHKAVATGPHPSPLWVGCSGWSQGLAAIAST